MPLPGVRDATPQRRVALLAGMDIGNKDVANIAALPGASACAAGLTRDRTRPDGGVHERDAACDRPHPRRTPTRRTPTPAPASACCRSSPPPARSPPPSSPRSSTSRPPGSVGTSGSSRRRTRSPCTTGRARPKGRGRPARRYVVTSRGQAALSHRYSELASQALRFLAETAGPQAVQGFAEQRVRDLEERHAAGGRRRGGRRRRARPRAGRRAHRRRVRRLGAAGARRHGHAAVPGPLPGPGRRARVPGAVRGRGARVLAAARRARAAPRDAGRWRPRLHHEHPLIDSHPDPRPAHPVLSVEGQSA